MKLSLVCLTLISLLGCGAPTSRSTEALILDLAARLDRAEVSTETSDIDFGSKAARIFLGEGWSWNEQEPAGTTFVWSSRYSSEVHFFIVDTGSRTVRFRCKPLRRGLDQVESLSIRLNGSSLRSVPLRQGWHEYELMLPSNSLRQGVNRLVFEYSRRPGLARLRLLTTGDFELSRPRVVMNGSPPKLATTNPAAFPTAGIRRVRPSLILLYVIDTLRADHLTVYNDELNTSPGLARLMADGVVFTDAVA